MQPPLPSEKRFEPEPTVETSDNTVERHPRTWTVVYIIFGMIGVLLVASMLPWLGGYVGLLAALIPGGLDLQQGAMLGALAFLGLFIVGLVLVSVYRSRRRPS